MKIDRTRARPSSTTVDQAAERLVKHLEGTEAGKPVADLKEHIDDIRDGLDLRRSDLVDAAVLALAQLQEPQAVIDGVIAEVATALKATPQKIADKMKAHVADGLAALAQAPVVNDAAFDAAMARPVDERRQVPSVEEGRTARPFGELKDIPAADHKIAVGKLAVEIKEKWGDQAFNAPVVDYFVKRFEELTGVHIVRADTVASLFRDFGDALRSLFEREMPITIVAGSNPADQKAARDLLKGIYDELESRGLQKRVAQVGRFGGGGVHEAAFTALEKVRNVDRIALGSATQATLTGPASVVDKALLFGSTLGEETWLTREFARRGVAIVFGGDAQSLDEAKDVLERNPSRTFVCGGFADGVDKQLAGKEATFIGDARTRPVEAGHRIGKQIADAIEREQRDLLADPLMQVAFQGSKGQLSDMVTALQQNAAQNRIVRIVTAVGERLERAGVPQQEIWQDVAQLSQNLARYTLGVDNFRDNDLWQRRAKEAFEVTGGRIKDIVDEASVDVYFASWGGIQRRP